MIFRPFASLPERSVLAAASLAHPDLKLHLRQRHQQNNCGSKTKSMDMRLWWLRCRKSLGQFRFYWALCPTNHSNYSTKSHPDIYHKFHWTSCAGLCQRYITSAHSKGVFLTSRCVHNCSVPDKTGKYECSYYPMRHHLLNHSNTQAMLGLGRRLLSSKI